MTALPPWAANAECRALLASIIANPPESRVTRGQWIDGGGRTIYRGWQRPDVARLKRIFIDWWAANHETAAAYPEDADALIGRLLAEEAQLTECVGDPMLAKNQRAA